MAVACTTPCWAWRGPRSRVTSLSNQASHSRWASEKVGKALQQRNAISYWQSLHCLLNSTRPLWFAAQGNECEDVRLWTSLVAQTVRRLPTMQETEVWSLGREDPLEREIATHSSTLAWKIPWTEEPGRLQSMALQRAGYDWATSLTYLRLEKLEGQVNCSLKTWKDIKRRRMIQGER